MAFELGFAADFNALAKLEFDSIQALYTFSRTGQGIANASGLIVIQSRDDLRAACLHMPVMEGRNAKARRAARPLSRAAWHLRGVQRCFRVLPDVFLKTYEQEIRHARGQHGKRTTIDLGKR